MNKFRLFFLLFITIFLSVTGGLGRIYYLDGAGYIINSLVSVIIAQSIVEVISNLITNLIRGDK
jgi:hypothetical protein